MKLKTEWWQSHQFCEDENGEDRSVKVTISILSPAVGHRLCQYRYPGGTTVEWVDLGRETWPFDFELW